MGGVTVNPIIQMLKRGVVHLPARHVESCPNDVDHLVGDDVTEMLLPRADGDAVVGHPRIAEAFEFQGGHLHTDTLANTVFHPEVPVSLSSAVCSAPDSQ